MTQPKWNLEQIPIIVTYEDKPAQEPKRPGINPVDYWMGGHLPEDLRRSEDYIGGEQ